MDKSKGDVLGKCVTLLQIVYYVAEIVVRAAQHLTVSPLEVGVGSTVASSVVLYCLCLQKPKSVGVPTTISCGNTEMSEIVERLRGYRADKLSITFASKFEEGDPLPNDFFPRMAQGSTGRSAAVPMALLLLVSGVLLGAMHLAGWNLDFPSDVDRWLWRGAAIGLVSQWLIVPVCLSIPLFPFASRRVRAAQWEPMWEDFDRLPNNKAIIFPSAVYGIARVILLVEMWRCLFYLPSDAYVATPVTMLPHFG